MRTISKYMIKYKWLIVLVILLAAVKSIASLLIPGVMGQVINAITNNISDEMINFFILMVFYSFIAFITHIGQSYVSAKISSSYQHDLRSALFKKVESLSLAELNDFETSSLITRTTSDINMIANFFAMLFRMGITMPILGIGGIILALRTAKGLSWIVVVSLSLMIISIVIIAMIVLPRSKRIQKLVDKLNLLTRESLTGIRVIRAFNATKVQTNKYKAANKNYYKNRVIVLITSAALNPVIGFIGSFSVIMAIYFGANLIDLGSLQIESIIVFIQYLTQILFSFILLTILVIMYPIVQVSANRVKEVLLKEKTIIETTDEKPMSENGSIIFKNVSFSYPGGEESVLNNISFQINPGERVAFIGSTGSGKSTIINLFPRLFDTTSGQIIFNGTDIKDLNIKELRSRIGFVPQKGNLFKGTIKENVKFSYENATNEEIEYALKNAMAYDFVMNKDEKLDFEVSQGGKNLSGGQRQRLGIARALVKKHDFLIFDDSLSALDYKTASKLQDNLNTNYQDTTIIYVAQRVSSIVGCDKIIVLDEGAVENIGTHQELLKKSKVYLEIASSQLSKEELGL